LDFDCRAVRGVEERGRARLFGEDALRFLGAGTLIHNPYELTNLSEHLASIVASKASKHLIALLRGIEDGVDYASDDIGSLSIDANFLMLARLIVGPEHGRRKVPQALCVELLADALKHPPSELARTNGVAEIPERKTHDASEFIALRRHLRH
jgi:hypothetical protein